MLTRATAVAIAFISAGIISTAVLQSQDQQVPSAAGRIQGKPNLTGLWQAMTEANWDIQRPRARPGPSQFGAMFSEPAGVGIVEGNEIPYQPAAAEQKK